MKRFVLILIFSLVAFFALAGGIHTAEDLVAFSKAVNQFRSSGGTGSHMSVRTSPSG